MRRFTWAGRLRFVLTNRAYARWMLLCLLGSLAAYAVTAYWLPDVLQSADAKLGILWGCLFTVSMVWIFVSGGQFWFELQALRLREMHIREILPRVPEHIREPLANLMLQERFDDARELLEREEFHLTAPPEESRQLH